MAIDLPHRAARSHDVIGRPRHRLFGAFDDPRVGLDALEKMAVPHSDEDEIWALTGEDGLQKLDISGGAEGLWGRIVRIVELAMSSDIEYLRVLEGVLESGGLVVSIPVKDADDADDLADLLGARAGHSFAYFSNWEFQPVRGQLEDRAER